MARPITINGKFKDFMMEDKELHIVKRINSLDTGKIFIEKTPFSIPRNLWRIPLTVGWVIINYIAMEKDKATSTN